MLTNDQIQYLFTFCEKHSVHYYDVQVELVDHLANAVEEEMKTDSNLNFEAAVEKVHKSFGFSGFAPLVREKQKFAERQSRRLFWNLFKSHFQWPKILLFLLLFSFLFTLFSSELFLIKYVFAGAMISGIGIWIKFLWLQRHIASTGKKFLIMKFSWLFAVLYLPTNFLNISRLFNEQSFLQYTPHAVLIPLGSCLISIFIIILITALQTFSSVKKVLYQTYPEVFSPIS